MGCTGVGGDVEGKGAGIPPDAFCGTCEDDAATVAAGGKAGVLDELG